MRCLRRSGYSGATLVRIAKEADVTTGALQHHFEGRRDLMQSVVREAYERLVSDVAEQLPSSGSLRERVDGAIDAMVVSYGTASALGAFEVVLALRDDGEFSSQHLGIAAPYAAELDRQWLELFADSDVSEASKRIARQVARTCILGLLTSAASGLAVVDQHTVGGLKESVFHLLSPN